MSVLETDFEDVWKSYPNKAGKNLAKRSYIKSRKVGVQTGDVISGLNRYVVYVESRRAGGFPDLKYKDGGTWFCGECWTDEYTCDDPLPKPNGLTSKVQELMLVFRKNVVVTSMVKREFLKDHKAELTEAEYDKLRSAI